jgi:hypothetical protein
MARLFDPFPVELHKSQRCASADEGSGHCARYHEMSAALKEEQKGDPNLPSWLVTLSFGSHVSRALLDWCDEADEMLSSRRYVRTEST